MAEYFDISLISKKSPSSKTEMESCLKQYGLTEGENRMDLFGNGQIIVTFIDSSETNFEEVCVGIPRQVFHRSSFDEEIKVYTGFINGCFETNRNLEYAVCSYELNGYLLGTIRKFERINSDFLKRFPIVYKRVKPLEPPVLQVNQEAQEIFV